jgi:hypothetical protein
MSNESPIIISTISEKEMAERYGRTKQPKMIIDDEVVSPPSSPPLTKHVIQLSSGRRNGVQPKNSPNSQRRSEKRVSSRGPVLEQGKLKESITVLTPVKIEEKATPSPKSVLPPDGKIVIEEIKQNIEINEPNPIVSGKRFSNERKIETNINGEKIVHAKPKSRDEMIKEIRKEKEKKEIGSPPAERRSPKPKKWAEEDPDMRISNRRSASSRRRPVSPHRKKKKETAVNIKIDGEDLSDLDDLGDSFSSSSSISIRQYQSEKKKDSTSNHIRSRKAVLEASDKTRPKKKPVEKEFYPEDDENLKEAIKVALEESKKKSVQEAIDDGLEFNAEILKSMNRPNALEEVIESMVSKRREMIRESKRAPVKSHTKDFKFHQEEEPDIETMDEEELPPPPKPKVTMTIDDNIPNAVKETIKKENQTETETVKPKKQVKVVDVAKQLEDDDADEEDEKVKLPPAFAKQKRGDMKSDVPWSIGGENDRAYDPLNLGGTVEDEQEYEGDNAYEESSEDDNKLTIDERKDEMMYRFRCIKEAYPTVALPRITKRMKLAKMVRLYEHVQSKIKLKVKTGNFKILLVGGFLVMQFLGNKLGLDMHGFTVNQMYSINVYNRLLRELGEAEWAGIGIELPVMVRLPFFMLVNAGIFVVAKFIFRRTGKDLTAEFQKLYSQLVGNDDFVFIKADGTQKGMDHNNGDEEEGGDNGGLFGMIKSFMSMMGGGGGDKKEKPKRGEASGPTAYKKKAKK